ncbi:hypothetical protein DT076_01150 [Desertihabitans brevis]|uniref:Uncharacterized protein n=1 Tax=Desertihabitans brevis TaxID=2268447 RepID=A0A367YYY5_9ACTN|nr:HGxxPAAW family protein [Desertihabitans brevis]RCK71106.1 hypothetical protein DT076_01150 [Desertihabitans brevis]
MSDAPARSHTHPRYHHGRSPAAWAGVMICLVGFFVATIGFLVGPGPDITPHWLVIGIGGAIIAAGCVVTAVMRALGRGND